MYDKPFHLCAQDIYSLSESFLVTFKMSCFQPNFSYGPTSMTLKNSENHVIFDRKFTEFMAIFFLFLFSWLLIRWDQWAVNEWIIKHQPSSTFPKFVSEQTWSVNLERKIKSKFMVKKFQLHSLERFFLNLNLTRKFPWLYGWIFVYKVHIFCHKILRNLHLTFVCMYCRQK